jgi:hypothetical protein
VSFVDDPGVGRCADCSFDSDAEPLPDVGDDGFDAESVGSAEATPNPAWPVTSAAPTPIATVNAATLPPCFDAYIARAPRAARRLRAVPATELSPTLPVVRWITRYLKVFDTRRP